MAVNKVVYDGNTLIDLTNSTVSTDTLAEGVTAYAADGSLITGVAPTSAVLYTEQSLTSDQQQQAINNLGVTATPTELNYVDGVTSNIQTQLNAKAASSHTHSNYLTTSSTAYSSARLASDTLKLVSTETTVTLAASGYLSQQTVVPTAVDGYTLIAPVSLSSNSSYTSCYHLYYSSKKLGFSVRNYATKEVEAKITIFALYVKTS